MYYGVRDPRVHYMPPDPALEQMRTEAVRRQYGDAIALMASDKPSDNLRTDAAYWIAFGMAAYQHKNWCECDEIASAARQMTKDDIGRMREEQERAEQMADEDRRMGGND